MSNDFQNRFQAASARIKAGRDLAERLRERTFPKDFLDASLDAVKNMVSPVRFEQSTVTATIMPHAPHRLNKLLELA